MPTLSQIAVRNIIKNGIIHSPESSEITVSVDRSGSVSVEDCGPGIPVADREQIFERFWRGRAATSHGAGLGLSIAREILNSHHGSVRVDDRVGGGSVFILSFVPANVTKP